MSDTDRDGIGPTHHLGGRQRLGDHIGPYELVELLGEGGMGQVFLARQREPIRREVAIKLIKWGMDTERVVARFELERQTQAIMEHPHIAKVLDAGATEDGRPFFVMEYVPGIPLTEYCDRHRLSTEQRLQLFVDVCEAVQHAHQKGIIHRDLKPSNVLVEEIDDRPSAKIIDFGVAKATAQQLVERTLFTEQGQLVGTPEYMSPEQAEHGDARIDTRTDIYSLGVLLYELMIGVLPFDSKSLRSRGLAEIHRILREEEPPRPSTRLSEQGDLSTETAQRRRTSAKVLLSELRGDLDQIVMKAMDKDRTRRYASASEFAADVRRYLHQEPVLATPPSLRYRAQKFVRRNRGLVAALAAVTLALVLGIAGSTWQAIRATRAEGEARRQAELATRTRDYLLTVFEQANPATNALGRETTIQEALDRATLELGDRFDSEPVLDATIRQTLGDAYDAMGAYETAEAQARAALEKLESIGAGWDPQGFDSRRLLADVLAHRGQLAQAENVLREALERPEFEELESRLRAAFLSRLADTRQRRGAYGEADSLYVIATGLLEGVGGAETQLQAIRQWHASHLRLMGRLTESERMLRELLDELPSGDASLYRRSFLRGSLANVLAQLGRTDEALEVAASVLDDQTRVLGPDHSVVGHTLNQLAGLHIEASRYDAAMQYAERSRGVLEASVGRDHPSVLSVRNTIANIQSYQGDGEAALAAHRELLGDRIRIQGADHPDIVLARTNLADLLEEYGHYDDATAMIDAAIETGVRTLGPNHRVMLAARNRRADLLQIAGRFDDARAIYEQIIADAESDPDLGRHHPQALQAIGDLGWVLGTLGRHEEAIGYIEEFLRVSTVRFPEGHSEQQTSWNNLASVRQAQGDLDGAVEAYERSLSMGVRILGEEHPDLTIVRNNLASVERERGRYAEAERLFARVVEDFRSEFGPAHPKTLAGMHNHGYTLIFLERYEEAEEELRSAFESIREILPETHLYCLIFRSSLGYCRAHLGEFEQAEEDLLWAYANVEEQLGEDHPRSRKIAGYLVETYERWERPDAAERWRERAESSSDE